MIRRAAARTRSQSASVVSETPGNWPATALAAEQAFNLLNAWGGMAIGEHIGQLLTAIFVIQFAMLQAGEGRRIAAPVGFLSGVLLIAGSGEGLALAVGAPGGLFSLTTIAGFVGLTVWLITTGVGLIRNR